jgi:Lon protease-like protein
VRRFRSRKPTDILPAWLHTAVDCTKLSMEAKITTCVERMYAPLVDGRYADLAMLTGGIRLTADEIRAAASGYRYALRPWPPDQPMYIDAVEVVQSLPRAWSIRADAFTAEEGRSDLSMELTVIESQSGNLIVQFDNLHIL